jgi:hypothetical protein
MHARRVIYPDGTADPYVELSLQSRTPIVLAAKKGVDAPRTSCWHGRGRPGMPPPTAPLALGSRC